MKVTTSDRLKSLMEERRLKQVDIYLICLYHIVKNTISR